MAGIAHDPNGGLFTGDILDPDTFCMSTDQIGDVLAAAFIKTNEAFIQALTVFIVIALIVGIIIGAGAMYIKFRLDAAESVDGE